MSIGAMSLWDAEDEGTADLKVRDMVVAPVNQSDVREFCRRYHYSVTGGNMMWNWGLWHSATLLGVVAYNLPTRTACESVFGPEHFDKVWHMGRLAMAEDAPRNSESRLIGLSLKEIQRKHPSTWGVLTYAATDAGHLGYVYQATNALYTGTGGNTHYWLDGSGQRRAAHLDGKTIRESDVGPLGWTRHASSPKHRYVYILGSKSQRRQRRALLRYPVLPYPKAAP